MPRPLAPPCSARSALLWFALSHCGITPCTLLPSPLPSPPALSSLLCCALSSHLLSSRLIPPRSTPPHPQAAPVVNAKDLPVIGDVPEYNTFAEHAVAHIRTIHIGFYGQHLRVEVEPPAQRQRTGSKGEMAKQKRCYVFVTRQKSLSINLVRILASIGSEVEILNEDAYSTEQMRTIFDNHDEQVKLYQYVYAGGRDGEQRRDDDDDDDDDDGDGDDTAELSLLVVTNKKVYLCEVDFESQAKHFGAGASEAFHVRDEEPSISVRKSQPLALLLSVGDKVDKVNTLTLWFKPSGTFSFFAGNTSLQLAMLPEQKEATVRTLRRLTS